MPRMAAQQTQKKQHIANATIPVTAGAQQLWKKQRMIGAHMKELHQLLCQLMHQLSPLLQPLLHLWGLQKQWLQQRTAMVFVKELVNPMHMQSFGCSTNMTQKKQHHANAASPVAAITQKLWMK